MWGYYNENDGSCDIGVYLEDVTIPDQYLRTGYPTQSDFICLEGEDIDLDGYYDREADTNNDGIFETIVDDESSPGASCSKYYYLETLPNNPDTDEDGFRDGEEYLSQVKVQGNYKYTDPFDWDSDDDGWNDGDESGDL